MEIAIHEDFLDGRLRDVVFGDDLPKIVIQLCEALCDPGGRIRADDARNDRPRTRPSRLEDSVAGPRETGIDSQYEHMFGEVTGPK